MNLLQYMSQSNCSNNQSAVLNTKDTSEVGSLSMIKWICFELTTAFDKSRVVTGTLTPLLCLSV